jgi:hypothetical protein
MADLSSALYARSPDTLPMIAKRSLRDDWESQHSNLLKKAKEELLGADVKFVADYVTMWKTIVQGAKVLVLTPI